MFDIFLKTFFKNSKGKRGVYRRQFLDVNDLPQVVLDKLEELFPEHILSHGNYRSSRSKKWKTHYTFKLTTTTGEEISIEYEHNKSDDSIYELEINHVTNKSFLNKVSLNPRDLPGHLQSAVDTQLKKFFNGYETDTLESGLWQGVQAYALKGKGDSHWKFKLKLTIEGKILQVEKKAFSAESAV